MTLEPAPDMSRLPTLLGGVYEGMPKVGPWGPAQDAELKDAFTAMASLPPGRGRQMEPQVTYPKTVIPAEMIFANSTLLHAHLYRRPVLDAALRTHQEQLLGIAEAAVTNAVLYAQINTARGYEARDTGKNRLSRHFMLAVNTWLEFSARIVQVRRGGGA